jgi:predicted signal transduction protein with EAL and GGDEF domain
MEVLHRLGCSVMQGFLFSRAVPADELQRWLERAELPRRASWADMALDSSTDHGGMPAAAARCLR